MSLEYVSTDEGRCSVHAVPRDGSCLFGAIAHQIFRYRIGSPMHVAMVMTLREMSVDHIRLRLAAADDRYAHAVSLRTNDEYSMYSMTASSAMIVDAFLMDLKSSPIWGGEETLLAISELFQCSIYIYRENSFRICVNANAFPVEREISIVYRGLLNCWDHYDSFDRLVPEPLIVEADVAESVATDNFPAATSTGGVNVRSWNVRSCHAASKRLAIDADLHQNRIHVAFL